MEAHDANYVGGDINAGVADIRQLLFRPVAARWTRITPGPGSICARRRRRPAAASTGWAAILAARSALRRDLR